MIKVTLMQTETRHVAEFTGDTAVIRGPDLHVGSRRVASK
jgi:hypothetical protein